MSLRRWFIREVRGKERQQEPVGIGWLSIWTRTWHLARQVHWSSQGITPNNGIQAIKNSTKRQQHHQKSLRRARERTARSNRECGFKRRRKVQPTCLRGDDERQQVGAVEDIVIVILECTSIETVGKAIEWYINKDFPSNKEARSHRRQHV